MTGAYLGFFGTALATYFAMCNPISNTAIFMGMTPDDDAETKKAIARKGLIFAFGMIAVMSVGGKLIGELFGIGLPAFRVTGGIVVFMIGYEMLKGSSSDMQHEGVQDEDRAARLDIAVSPLGTPILAGAGTIAAAVNFAAQDGVAGILISLLAFALICLITYVLFLSGDRIQQRIGQGGLNAVTRVMGLILATIGMTLIFNGLGGQIEGFVQTTFPLLP